VHTKITELSYRFTPQIAASVGFLVDGSVYARGYARLRAYTRTYARVSRTLAGLFLVGGLLLPITAFAATQGYATQDKTITKGMAVAVASSQAVAGTDSKTTVEKSSVGNASKTLGVVVDPAKDAVAVSAEGGQVYVATTGSAMVYVTDLNGTVHKGDLLAPSPLEGVLMRGVDGTRGILGVAVTDFATKTAQSVTVKATTGDAKAKVALQQINMDTKFTVNTPNNGKSLLQRVGEAIVHHEVSTVQVLVALAILCLLLVVEGGVVYGAISSSIVSLGRNPLAKGTIMKGLGQITVLVTVILAIGVAAVYLVLWI
jgi:uncharacterized protein YycO